ncbi:MAG: hypothetical protein LBO69_05640 [Ignavibacteria bacterium]|jgi:hypothetical protein|nr:hypothetical protein [Ignavibacteria bacterium]
MPEYQIIETKIFRNTKEYQFQREQRIIEAVSFSSGTIEKQKKHIISILPNGKETYFLKPGKETIRTNPNIYDMFPNVGKDNASETDSFSFDVIWEYLLKISIINQITFKKVLVLLYRLCYFIDHKEIAKKIRYSPSKELLDYIDKIDFSLKDGFRDKFKKDEIGLLEFLNFVDLLGWNEDVKYHTVNNQPNFINYGKNVGRINTILSIISVPLKINDFLDNIIKNAKVIENIDIKLILSTMQTLSKSRGIYALPHSKLQEYLKPYLID